MCVCVSVCPKRNSKENNFSWTNAGYYYCRVGIKHKIFELWTLEVFFLNFDMKLTIIRQIYIGIQVSSGPSQLYFFPTKYILIIQSRHTICTKLEVLEWCIIIICHFYQFWLNWGNVFPNIKRYSLLWS